MNNLIKKKLTNLWITLKDKLWSLLKWNKNYFDKEVKITGNLNIYYFDFKDFILSNKKKSFLNQAEINEHEWFLLLLEIQNHNYEYQRDISLTHAFKIKNEDELNFLILKKINNFLDSNYTDITINKIYLKGWKILK